MINVSIEVGDTRWRLAMALSTALPLLYIICMPWLPETPRWLALSGRFVEANNVLRVLDPALTEADAAAAMAAMAASTHARAYVEEPPGGPHASADHSVERESSALFNCDRRTGSDGGSGHVAELGWAESLCPPSKRDRQRVLLALALGLTQQLTGTEAILYYTPKILNQVGCLALGSRPSDS